MNNSIRHFLFVLTIITFNHTTSIAQKSEHTASETMQSHASNKDQVSKNVLMHHLGAFQKNDLKAIMADYTDESVIVTPQGTYAGLEQIEAFMARLITLFPTQGTILTMDHMTIVDELIFIVWHAESPKAIVPQGSDTFIIENGKIKQQTFIGELKLIDN